MSDETEKPKEIDFYSRMSDYAWLSNFHYYPQIVDGRTYPTNEHFYQSQKAIMKEKEDWIASAKTPLEAKNRAKDLKISEMKSDWNKIKKDIMLKGLRAKFQNPELRKKLLETGDAILHEASPTDLYWGKRGRDILGKLIMKVRTEIQSDDLFG